jgi:hypothetical protein
MVWKFDKSARLKSQRGLQLSKTRMTVRKQKWLVKQLEKIPQLKRKRVHIIPNRRRVTNVSIKSVQNY